MIPKPAANPAGKKPPFVLSFPYGWLQTTVASERRQMRWGQAGEVKAAGFETLAHPRFLMHGI
jgi:hypothetical protein